MRQVLASMVTSEAQTAHRRRTWRCCRYIKCIADLNEPDRVDHDEDPPELDCLQALHVAGEAGGKEQRIWETERCGLLG